MLFSDIKKKLVDATIFGKLKKKKIKIITDHSEDVNSNALLVINNNRKFKRSYLTKAINQLAIKLPIESIQVKSSKDNKTVYKKNTSVPQDPIDPSITKIYKCIIELDLSINS